MPVKKNDDQGGEFRLADFLPYKLAVVTDAVSRVFAEYYEGSYNLTISEWRALAVLAERGTLSPTAVGQLTMMDKVKVSRAAHGLVAKGLVRQTQDPSDGRGRLLRVTRRGTTTHAGMVPLARSLEAALFEGCSQAERAALDRILQKVITRLETNDWNPVG